MIEINLFNLSEGNNLGIIPCKSNVIWQTQVGCLFCNQIRAEGIAIPLAYMHLRCDVSESDIKELMERTEAMYNMAKLSSKYRLKYEIVTIEEAWVELKMHSFGNLITFNKETDIAEFNTMYITWRNCD